MATGKRYYWIKLRESFMSSDTVDFLMSQKDGANYVVLYQMLCLKTINTGGRLSRTIGEIVIPYDVEKIQRDCKWFSIDTIRIALNLYKRFGLIYEEQDGTLVLAEHDELVGSETNWAAQKRNQRSDPPVLPGGHCPPPCPQDVPGNVHPDIRDIDTREKIPDIRDIEKKNESISGSDEPVPGSTPPTKPPVILLPLIDGSDYAISQEDVNEYSALYQAVDIMQELRKMVGWLKANPKRRKTIKGIKRFVNNWLSSEQDRGGTYRNGRSQPVPPAVDPRYDYSRDDENDPYKNWG